MRNRLLVALTLLLAAALGAAQTPAPSTYDRAIAAGYKALTLCSAAFLGGRTHAQVEALELTGIYPEYDAIVPTLEARVTTYRSEPEQRGELPQTWYGLVTVPFDAALNPREARWHIIEGCTLDPIHGSGIEALVPRAIGNVPVFAGSRDDQAWPTGDRMPPIRTPPRLAPVAARGFDGANYGDGRTTAILIVHNGRIVSERYAPGFGMHTAQRTWSVAKSIAGTLVGIAVRDGLLRAGPTDRARIPEWRDSRRGITMDDLLRMASGLHSSTEGNRTDAVYFGGVSVTEETVPWPLDVQPGTRFRYANNDILLAIRALRAALDDDTRYHAFPRQRLFAPLGMTRTVAETDPLGNFILSSQVWSTARDLARFGLLYLNDGVWSGQRILPENWRAYVTRASGPQPDGAFGYGATFWLISRSEGVPPDAFAAFGNRGQYVVIVPSRNLVIVRRGEDAARTRFDIARFTADVVGALR